jgi:hypothetical protein
MPPGADGRAPTRLLRMVVALLVAAVLLASVGILAAGADDPDGVAIAGATGSAKIDRKLKRLSKKVKKQSRKLKRLDGRVGALEGSSSGPLSENYAAAAFTPVEDSTHNNAGSSVCGSFVASEKGAENKGDLNAKLGSFLAPVVLPDGATIERLAMFANDFSAEDAHLYLIRKQIENGLDPQFEGYEELATVTTDGAVNNVMREFSVAVSDGVVDNSREYYFLELVVCDFIEPFAVPVRHR